MDILILRLRVNSATSYAIGHAEGDDTYDAFLSSVQDWASNLKTQKYTQIVSVLLAFQWSDPTLGPPWTHIEDVQPPHRAAGNEIEAMFSAERMARQPNLYKTLGSSRLRRSGPIGLMEARVLGSELSTNVQAKLLGRALTTLNEINPFEREVLELIEKPVALPELLVLTREVNLQEEDVLVAIVSLLRHGLISLISSSELYESKVSKIIER